MKPPILVLHAAGTNRDVEVAWACDRAGGAAQIVHLAQLLDGSPRLADFRMLVLPGGFSFGDDLGAGKLWAIALRHRLGPDLARFVESGRPVLGICNGFQALVKAGVLPGVTPDDRPTDEQRVTLTHNDSGHFECRWVTLTAAPESPCVFTRGLDDPIECPVAHGEGKVVTHDDATLSHIERRGLVALRYATSEKTTPAPYPANPNGSEADIAGLTNPAGNVLGLMPHPEDHLVPEQHPRSHRGERGHSGLRLFQNGVRHAAEV